MKLYFSDAMKKQLFLGLKIATSLVLVYWLIDHVDWQGVRHELESVSWFLLFLYVVFQLVGLALNAKKWQIIAAHKGIQFTWLKGFFINLTGTFMNNFFPSTIGADAYRSLWLARVSGQKAAALSTVVFDRFIGLWTTAVLALVGGAFLMVPLGFPFPLMITLAALAGFLVVDALLTYLYNKNLFTTLINRIPFHKLRRFIEEVALFANKKIWFQASLWSAAFIFVGLGLSNYTLFQAVGTDISFFTFFSITMLVSIVSSIPISIGNIGIKEWAYVVFFGLVGVSVETAVTVALLSRFIQMFLSFGALPHYLSLREKGTPPTEA